MADFKWEEVAHHYIGSSIKAEHMGNEVYMSEARPGYVLWQYTDDSLVDFPIEDIDGLPILRHTDDMTEAEAIELYNFVYQDNDPETYVRICRGWARSNIAAGKYTPRVLHWLFSHGFDMFDLIDSGQAIRKDMAGGGKLPSKA